jgi:hypothetical protein
MIFKKLLFVRCKSGHVLLALLSFLAFSFQAVHAEPYPPMTAAMPTPSPAPQKRLNADTVQIEIRGSAAFIVQTRAALNLLSQCDPDALLKVDTYLDRIQEYNRSGMEIASNTFLASNTTDLLPATRVKLSYFGMQVQLFMMLTTIGKVQMAEIRIGAACP